MPSRNYYEQNLATLKQLLESERQRKQAAEIQAEGYRQLALDNPSLASAVYSNGTVDYRAALTQTLQQIIDNPTNSDPDEVKRLIKSNPLLQSVYGKTDAELNAYANRIARRVATGNYDPLVDADPRTQIKPANVTGNQILPNWAPEWLDGAVDYIANDIIGQPFDRLQQNITDTYLSETNKLKADDIERAKYLNAASPEVKSSVAKMGLLKQIQAENYNLQQLLKNETDRDRVEELLRHISINNDKINNISNSLSDAEKTAYQREGALYEQNQAIREANKERIEALTPRYASDVAVDMANAQLQYEELIRNGKADVFDHPVYGLKYLLNQFASPAALSRNARVILPWVAMGMAKPLFALAGGMGLTSAVTSADLDYMDDYFDQHGALEGYNQGLASLMNGIGFIMDLAGGRLLGGLSKNVFKQSILGQAEKILKPALQASITTGSNAPLKAGFKTVFNNLRLDQMFIKAGEKLSEKASLRDVTRAAKGDFTSGIISKAENALGTTLKDIGRVEGALGQPLKHAAASDLSLAFENATATAARQVAAQNGIDENAIAKAALEGLATGHLGMAQGAAMAPVSGTVAKAVRTGQDKYLRTESEEETNRKSYEDLSDKEKYQRATAELDSFEHIKDKVYASELDAKGKKLAKKYKDELTYDLGTHQLKPVAGKELSEEAKKVINEFDNRKSKVQAITDKIGERKDYYTSIADKALDNLIKEAGVKAYEDASVREALADKDVDEVAKRLQSVKGISEKTAKLQAKMLTNKTANINAKDIGILQDAFDTSELMDADTTLLTDISKNQDAQDALGRADFTEFQKAIDKQIADNETTIKNEKKQASPNAERIQELQDTNKRLDNLKKEFTQDKWNNKKNALIGEKDTDERMRKLDKSVIPDKNKLGITDEARIGKTADDIKNALNDIKAKDISKGDFLDSLINRNSKKQYVDNTGTPFAENELKALTDKLGKYYDDYTTQLKENIDDYNTHQQYKVYSKESDLTAELKKHNATEVYKVKKIKNRKTKKDEYYAEIIDTEELNSSKAYKQLKDFIEHPSHRISKQDEFYKILDNNRTKEIIKNATHVALRKRILGLIPGVKSKKSINNFDHTIYEKMSAQDQKEMLNYLEKAYKASKDKEVKLAGEAIMSFDSEAIRRYTGYSTGQQKRNLAFTRANKEKIEKDLRKKQIRQNERFRAAGAESIYKMDDDQLGHFITTLFATDRLNLNVPNSNNDIFHHLSANPTATGTNRQVMTRFVNDLHRSAKFDDQLAALIAIVKERANRPDNASEEFRNIFSALEALQAIINQSGVAPEESGESLWARSTISSSQKDAFASRPEMQNAYVNLNHTAAELNRRLRNTQGITFPQMTNSQEIEDFTDESMLSPVFQSSDVADSFFGHHQLLTIQHENAVLDAIADRLITQTHIWDFASAWFVTDRDAGYDHYSTALQHFLNTCTDEDVKKFFIANRRDGAGQSVNNWINAFHNESQPMRRRIVKALLNNNATLAIILGHHFNNLNDPTRPDQPNTITWTADEYTTHVNQLVADLTLQGDAQTYFEFSLAKNAISTGIVNLADGDNIRNRTVIDYLQNTDTDIEQGLRTLHIDSILTSQYFTGLATETSVAYNEIPTWHKPSYTDLAAHLRGFTTDPTAIAYVAANFGRILYRIRLAQEQANLNNPDISISLNARNRLAHTFNYRNAVIPNYQGRTHLPKLDTVSERDFRYLRELLKDNQATNLTLADLQQYAPSITQADFDAYIINNGQYVSTLPTSLSTAKQKELAIAMAHYIISHRGIQTDLNRGNRNNRYHFNPPENQTVTLPNGRHPPVDSLIDLMHTRAEQSGYLIDGDYHDRHTHSVLDYENGWERLFTENPDLANNQAVRLAKQMAEASQGRIKLGNDFASIIEGIDGDFSAPYLNNVAAITANFLPRLTGENSDDFIDKLAQKSIGLAKYFMDHPVMDKTRLAKQIGAMVARKMGIRRNTAVYDNYVLASGAIALLMLKEQGLIEEIYLDQVTGEPRPDNNKAGAYPVIRLTEHGQDVRTAVDRDTTYEVNGANYFILDDILGVSFNSDLRLYAFENMEARDRSYTDFLQEWDHEHNGAFGFATVADLLANAQTNNEATHVYHAGDYAVVVLAPRDGHTEYECFVFDNVTKTDRTTVEDSRLITLAELQRNGRYLNVFAARTTYGCFLDEHGNMRFTEADVDNVDNICGANNLDALPPEQRALKIALRTAIGWEDPYANSTSIYAGNIHNNNVNAFRNAIRTVNALRNIQLGNGQRINIFDPRDAHYNDAQIRLRFDEINTVNNRLFVNSLAGNYRENKIIRNLFDNYSTNDLTFTVNDPTANSDQILWDDVATTFFHSLGMGADKVPQDADMVAGFLRVLRYEDFQNLVRNVNRIVGNSRNLTTANVSEIITAVNTFNASINEDNPQLTYTITKAAKHKNVDERFQIDVSKPNGLAAFLNFCSQITIQTRRGNISVIDYGLDNLANDIEDQRSLTIHNWTMRCEVDGLTNGPSVKANAVGLKENRDPFSKVLLGSVGINSRFINVFEAQQNGLLDVYLVSGEFARAEMADTVITEFVNSRGKSDTILPYLSALFNRGETATDYMDILANIFDRNMLKYPVMYTNYGAGKAGILLNVLVLFDKQFSALAAHPNTNREVLKVWLKNLVRMTGQKTFTFTYLPEHARHAQFIKVNANGDVVEGLPATGFSGGNNIFSNPALMSHIAFEHARNPEVQIQLYKVLNKLYEAMAKNLDSLNTPYKKVTESAQCIAEVFNEVVQNQVTKALPDIKDSSKSGMDATEYIRLVHTITENTLDIMSGIIRIGEDNGSTLRTIRDSVTDSVMEALSVYVTTKDGKYYSRVKQVIAAKESLGAGNVPMFIHSYDSYIMHQFLNIMLLQHDITITSIHDAILARPTETGRSPELNRQHYMSGPRQLGTFACMVRNLNQAKNALHTFGLDPEVIEKLSYKLQAAQDDMFSETLSLMQQNLRWLEHQRTLALDQRVPDNQYSYRSRSVYRPTDADLDDMIRGLRESMNNLIDDQHAIPLAENAIVRLILNANVLTTAERNALLTKENQLSNNIVKGVHSVDELIDRVNQALHGSNHGFHLNRQQVMLNIQRDPVESNMRQVLHALSTPRSTVGTPETITKQQYDAAIRNVRNRADITSFVEAVYAAKNFYTQNNIFTLRDSDTEIQRRLTAGVIKWVNSGKPLTSWGVFELLRQITGLHLLSSENSADFNSISTIIDSKHNVKPDINTFDTGRDFKLHVSDDVDYHAIWERFNSRDTYESLLTGSHRGVDSLVDHWYEQNVVKHMEDTYAGYNGQVVFTLRSNFELLELRALQELKDKNPAFKNVTIVVTPGITNIQGVNPELYFFQELCGRSHATSKKLVYRTAPNRSKNNDLLALVLNTEISESNLTNENVVTSEPHIYMANGARNGKEYVTVREFFNRLDSTPDPIQRMDEFGDSSVTQANSLTAFDLETEGVRGKNDIRYDFSEIADMSVVEAVETVRNGNFTSYNVNSDSVSDGSIEENLYGDDNSVILINTTSDGEILGPKVKSAYSTTAGLPYFNEAYSKFITTLNQRQADYKNHKLPNFTSVMMPVRVSVKTKLGRPKVFVFNPALQTALTRQELLSSFAEKGNADTFRDQVLADSPLYNMLKHEYRETREGIAEIRHFILSHSAGSPTDVIQIPSKFIDSTYMEDMNTSPEMQYKSALGLEKVLQDVSRAGYTNVFIPYENTGIYNDETPKILPDITGLTYGFINLASRNSTYDSALSKGYERNEEGLINNLKDKLVSKLRAPFRQHPDSPASVTDAVEVPEATHVSGYRGHIDAATLGTLQDTFRDGHDLVNTIQDAIADDAARGVRNGLIDDLLPTFRTLNTTIKYYLNDRDLTESFSLVANEGSGFETNVISLGSKVVGSRSKAEVLGHETIHTMLRHMGNDVRLTKEAQETYDYLQKNLKISDFTDGDTLENRAIMDAVFSAKTKNNIEEAICYFMTNEAFNTAVNRMTARKGNEKFITKVQNIIQRILNVIFDFFTGNESAKDLNVPAAMHHIFQECAVLNNKYWENKNYLKELGTEDLVNPLDLDANIVLKAGSSATEKFLQATSSKTLSGLALAVHDQSYVDELADSIRELCNIESGFVNDLIATLQGVSNNQLPYLKLRLQGKKHIDKQREDASATINNLVNKVLTNVSASTKRKLVTEFIRPDISCIFKYNETDDAYNYVTKATDRAQRISALENSLKTDTWYNYYINCAKGLAQYLVTGFNPTGLSYVNAYEIVAKAGSAQQQSVQENGSIHNAVDELISLYALDILEQVNPNFFTKIDKNILRQLSDIHNGIKEAENVDIDGNKFARLHVPKGELHISNKTHDYRIINEAEYKAYKWAGYSKVSDAELDPFTKAHYPDNKYIMVKGLFKSNVPIEAGCSILTDVFKGRLKGGITIDDITDENFHEGTGFNDLQGYINQRIIALNKPNPSLLTTPTSGNLILHFNSLNRLSGAKFEVNPVVEEVQSSAHIRIGNALGNLYGSIQERTHSTEENRRVAQSVIDIYENADDQENFEWISESSENEDYREYYKNLPTAIKEVLKEKYKDRGIPIRKSALNTFFGYKHLSANDTKTFIENERKAQANIDGLASQFKVAVKNLFYNKYVGYGESLARYLAKCGKENILIKGIATSWYNIVSNYILLGLNGLNPAKALSYEIEAIQQFLQIRDYNEKLQNLNQKKVVNTYTNEDARTEKGIKDALHKLPMYHLYQQGIVGDTLAEDLTESDRFLMNTIDKYTSKGIVNTLLHNAVMDPQGILYNILSDFASLGDVAGKYALYRYNKEKGMAETEAIRRSLNNFIDYSNPLPRSLQLLDDLAIMPFFKYALGIQNVIADTLVRHPERSLTWLFASGIFDLGNDIYGSLLGFDSLANRLQVPGKLFWDSLKTLPSVRLYDAIVE